MYINKTYFLFVVFCMIVSHNNLNAQSNVKPAEKIKRKYSFVLQLGGGYSTYTAGINIRPIGLPGSITRASASATIRLMWYPDRRLKLGVESGYTNFYSYRILNDNKPGKVILDAVPLLIVWSMPIVKRVNIYAGFGTYFLTTKLNYEGKVKSTAYVLGSNIALSYTKPISKTFAIAAEAKWMNAFETKDSELNLQVHMVWKFFQW